MHARRSPDDDEEDRSLDRDEDYQDGDTYDDEIMRQLKDEDRNYRDDDSEEEELEEEEVYNDNVTGNNLIFSNTTNSSLIKIIGHFQFSFLMNSCSNNLVPNRIKARKFINFFYLYNNLIPTIIMLLAGDFCQKYVLTREGWNKFYR